MSESEHPTEWIECFGGPRDGEKVRIPLGLKAVVLPGLTFKPTPAREEVTAPGFRHVYNRRAPLEGPAFLQHAEWVE